MARTKVRFITFISPYKFILNAIIYEKNYLSSRSNYLQPSCGK
jgi:hypothetical protein